MLFTIYRLFCTFILMVFTRVVTITLTIVTFTACQSAAIKLHKEAVNIGLKKEVITTTPIPIVIYKEPKLKPQSRLYLYLEGDGKPWDKGYWPASDPNTRQSVVLPLLAQSLLTYPKYNSIYLARPCYAWKVMPKDCHHSLWTSERYSQTVVDILDQGIDIIKRLYNVNQFILVGHSGGGTLAMLLATRRKDVAGVITLGANLDHSAWTQYFGYLPLSGSLNPATQNILPKTTARWHLIGGQDLTVPNKIIYQTGKKDPHANLITYDNFDHSCCWHMIWKNILTETQLTLDANQPNPDTNQRE